jgi:hypothetical protein
MAVKYAESFLGQRYLWGGDDPVGGFDCSGLICEILRATGNIGVRDRFASSALFDRFGHKTVTEPKRGSLIFWRDNTGQIRHVELALNAELALGAFGGDSSVDTLPDAAERNAFVGIRPIRRWRTGQLIFVEVFGDIEYQGQAESKKK